MQKWQIQHRRYIYFEGMHQSYFVQLCFMAVCVRLKKSLESDC